jgi:hypothetical protein
MNDNLYFAWPAGAGCQIRRACGIRANWIIPEPVNVYPRRTAKADPFALHGVLFARFLVKTDE